MMSKPFFNVSTTQRQVEALAKSPSLVVYAGAGVSIDRTGLSWSRLAHELLAHSGSSTGPTDDLAQSVGVQRLTSVAIERLRSIHGEKADQRIADILRLVLYRDSSWVSGDLIPQLHLLVSIRNALGYKTQILTTNYDEYLEEPFATAEVRIRVNGQDVSGDAASASTINYLHGRVPEIGDSTRLVVAEDEYAITQRRVCKEITEAFLDSDVLILGSSLTDPPLIRSLVTTRSVAKKRRNKRFVLVPRQGTPAASSAIGMGLLRDGSKHLGCEAIFPDFYSQIAQFVSEISVCTADPSLYVRPVNGSRYSARLGGWWSEWFAVVSEDEQAFQHAHHARLEQELESVRELLDAAAEEPLKIEIWVRWRPHDRRLRLWASSVGDWRDPSTARWGGISASSDYVSVRAFCEGHPVLYSEDPGRSDRWQSYLAVPIRVWGDPYGLGSHIGGTVTLASMEGEIDGSLSLSNRANLRRVLVQLNKLGEELLTPARLSL